VTTSQHTLLLLVHKVLHDPINLLIVDVLRRTGIVGFIVANICAVNDGIELTVWSHKVPVEVVPFSTSLLERGSVEILLRALPTSLKL
jgi:hypothetical protein